MRGEPPPPTLKVSLNSIGGFRNAATFVLTGLDIDAKADLVRSQLEAALTVKPAELDWTLARTDHADADTEADRQRAADTAWCATPTRTPWAANSPRPQSNSRSPAIPGFTTTAPPGRRPGLRGVHPRLRARPPRCQHVAVHADGTRVADPAGHRDPGTWPPPTTAALPEPLPAGPTRRVPLGTIAGARSGDKGGGANIGVWVRTERRSGAGWPTP